MANEGNLKPFEKGREKTGGRQIGTTNFKTLLEKYLKQRIDITQVDGKKKKVSVKEAMVLKLIAMAVTKEGNLKAIHEIMNRVDGMPKQEIKVDPESYIKVELTD